MSDPKKVLEPGEVRGLLHQAEETGTALAVRVVEGLILRSDISIKDIARALAPLPPPTQALALHGAFSEAIDKAVADARSGIEAMLRKENEFNKTSRVMSEEDKDTEAAKAAEPAKERYGRRTEAVVDELPDPSATISAMLEAGDTELVLSMVGGRIGEISTMVQYLSARHLVEFYMQDSDMQREIAGYGDDHAVDEAGRLIATAWTFVMETPLEHPGVNLFFFQTERGRGLVKDLSDAKSEGDEDASQILSRLRDRESHLILDEAAQAELDAIAKMEEREASRLAGG